MRIRIVKCWIHNLEGNSHECCRCLTTNPDNHLLIRFLFYDDVLADVPYGCSGTYKEGHDSHYRGLQECIIALEMENVALIDSSLEKT